MKRAFDQHPGDATLSIRKAGMLANEHQYQQALDIIKKTEAQGPPFPVQLHTIKANIYEQLQSPDLAVKVYKSLIAQGKKGDWFKKHSYERLIDIYHNKKDYAGCLTLSLDLQNENPDDEY